MMQTLAAFLWRQRRRLARLCLVLGVFVVARSLLPRWPRQTDLAFELGPDHAEIVALRIVYLDHGEALRGVSFDFPAGAPPTVRHRLSLPPGELELQAELRGRGGRAERYVRSLHTPAQGVVHITLGSATHAGAASRSPNALLRAEGGS
ncbi:MAG: hypothetical protein ACHQ53_05590 [Polyangiales bacterium]